MNHYTCPDCDAYLNVDGNLVLALKNAQGRCGIALMSDELGDYSVRINPHFHLEKGEICKFYCPACKKSLEYDKHEHRVRLFKQDDAGVESTILFSAVYGENATYELSEQRAKTYGELASKYKDSGWMLKED